MFGPLSLSGVNFIKSSKTLSKWFQPFAAWYIDAMGYRKYGLKYDDILPEESPNVQRALTRLTPREQFDRGFRLKRASHASVLHEPLPKEQWIKAEEDTLYLTPHVASIEAEEAERAHWNNLKVERR